MDIGFQEVFLIGVIALIVLGPERLPTAVRTIALWVSRIKRNFKSIQASIEQEINTEELRQRIHNENILHELGESKDILERSAKEIHDDISNAATSGNPSNSDHSNNSTS